MTNYDEWQVIEADSDEWWVVEPEIEYCPRCAMPRVGKAAQWPDCKCYFND